jgi:predicted transcriptional regulator
MESRFTTVNSLTPMEDVIYLLSQSEPAILVVDNDKLVGIITKIDAISSAINMKK